MSPGTQRKLAIVLAGLAVIAAAVLLMRDRPAPTDAARSGEHAAARGPRSRGRSGGAGAAELEATAPSLDGLRVHVRLAAGDPAVGARVRAWDVTRLWKREPGAVGDEQVVGDSGTVSFPLTSSGGKVGVYAVLPGYQTAGGVPEVTELPVDITLTFGAAGGVLSGTVTDAAGAPLADQPVRLLPVRRWEHGRSSGDWRLWSLPEIWDFYAPETRTDAAGRYHFVGVPLPRRGKPESRVAVVTDAQGDPWRSEEVAIETDGQGEVRDVVIGALRYDGGRVDPPGVHRRVAGRVVDRATGEPVTTARVIYAALSDGGVSWWGGAVDEKGRFHVAADDEAELASHRLELRVAALGYLVARTEPKSDHVRVELERRLAPLWPRRVTGRARGPGDEPLSGILRLVALDETYAARSQDVFADAQGRFEIEGLWPGRWEVFLQGSGDWQTVTVHATGEAHVELSTESPADAVVPVWNESRSRERAELRARVMVLQIEQAAHEERAGEIGDVARKLAQLDAAERATRPRRPLVVLGLPEGPGVVAAESSNLRFRAAVADGEAEFAGLPQGTWDLSLERPGEPLRKWTVELVAGDVPQEFEFDPDDT